MNTKNALRVATRATYYPLVLNSPPLWRHSETVLYRHKHFFETGPRLAGFSYSLGQWSALIYDLFRTSETPYRDNYHEKK